MPKSEEVLYLDPWAAALERKERLEKEKAERAAVVATHSEESGHPQVAPVALVTTEQQAPVTKVTTNKKVGDHKKPPTADRHSEDRERFQADIDPELKKQIQHFCVDRGWQFKDFADYVFRKFFENVGDHTLTPVVTEVTHDDLMIERRTNDDVIIMYRNYTGNKWKPADDRCANQFNAADRRLIEIGILNTLLNAKGKRINSFAYFVPEIEEVLTVKLSDETIDIMLPRRRAQWAARGK